MLFFLALFGQLRAVLVSDVGGCKDEQDEVTRLPPNSETSSTRVILSKLQVRELSLEDGADEEIDPLGF